MFVEINRFVDRITNWFLRNFPQPIDISEAISSFGAGIREFMGLTGNITSPILRENADKKFEHFVNLGVPATIAKRIAALEALSSACDVVQVARTNKLPLNYVGEIYFDLGQRLRLGWLRVMATRIVADSVWDRIAISSLVNDLYDEQRRLTNAVLVASKGKKKPSAGQTVEEWEAKNAARLARYNQFLTDLGATEQLDFSMLVVGMRNIEAIGSATGEAKAA